MGWVVKHVSPIIVGQAAIAAAALMALAFAPPAHGRMLVVPIDGEPVDRQLVRNAHATVLVQGPLPGSWIVEGQRARLARSFSSKGIIILAAPHAICADQQNGAEIVQ
jgi:hypothetical protein